MHQRKCSVHYIKPEPLSCLHSNPQTQPKHPSTRSTARQPTSSIHTNRVNKATHPALTPIYTSPFPTPPQTHLSLPLPHAPTTMFFRLRNFLSHLPEVWASTSPLGPTPASASLNSTLPGAYAVSKPTRSLLLFDMDKLGIPRENRPLFLALNKAVREYMYHERYDPSHDYEHIQRVVMFAHKLYTEEMRLRMKKESWMGKFMSVVLGSREKSGSSSANVYPDVDVTTMYLGAMMHDVGEPKYSEDGKTQEQVITALMTANGASESLAQRVADIAVNVSFTKEFTATDKSFIQGVIQRNPELADVQEADRLDAMGAAGMGRCFVFGGANQARRNQTIHRAVQLQDGRFRHYLGMMKTRVGLKEAKRKWARMERFRREWREETDVGGVL